MSNRNILDTVGRTSSGRRIEPSGSRSGSPTGSPTGSPQDSSVPPPKPPRLFLPPYANERPAMPRRPPVGRPLGKAASRSPTRPENEQDSDNSSSQGSVNSEPSSSRGSFNSDTSSSRGSVNSDTSSNHEDVHHAVPVIIDYPESDDEVTPPPRRVQTKPWVIDDSGPPSEPEAANPANLIEERDTSDDEAPTRSAKLRRVKDAAAKGLKKFGGAEYRLGKRGLRSGRDTLHAYKDQLKASREARGIHLKKESREAWPVKEVLGELIGTFLIVFLGTSCNVVMAAEKLDECQQQILRAILWGWAIVSATHLCGRLSGAHFNPIITVGFSVTGKFHPALVVPYILSQIIGALLGAYGAYALHQATIVGRFERDLFLNSQQVAAMFSAAQDPRVYYFYYFGSSFAAAFFYLLLLQAISDIKNERVPMGALAWLFGSLAFSTIHLVFGVAWIGGPQLNPTRDFAGLLVNYITGLRTIDGLSEVLYAFASFLGAIIGSWCYVLSCEYQWRSHRNDGRRLMNGPVRALVSKGLGPGCPRYMIHFKRGAVVAGTS